MEETSTATTTTKKKPLSLNQRYNHLLSASHSRPQLQPREEDNRSKLKVKADDAPHFSFSDIDSSPDVANLSNEKEFDAGDNYVDDELVDDEFSQSSVAEIDPPIEEPKMEKVKIEGRRRLCKVSSEVSDDDNDDHQNEIITQDSSVLIGKSKPEKVKIEGRRRLYKVSSGSKDDDDGGDDHQKEESHEFFDVSDYSSPPAGKDEGCGGNDIRNILDDLSSRLDFLSIEKKRNPKPVDQKVVPMGEDLLQEMKQKGVAQKDELENSEFDSVGSSLAALSDLSNSSSGVNGGVVEKGIEVETLSESDGEKFYEETNTNAYKGKLKDVSRDNEEEPVVSQKKSTYDIGKSKDVSRKIREESAVSQKKSAYDIGNSKDVSRKLKEESAVSQKKSTYDIGKSKDVSRKIKEESAVLQKKSTCDTGKSKDVSRKIKEEPVVSKKKSIYDFNYGSDEDEDDCVEVGRSNFTNRAERHGTLLDKENDDSGVVEVLGDDDDANEVVPKNDFSITFSDPRSTYKLPLKIGKMLYPHQREGLKWLWSLHCKGKGGILGDDMGLGKTMQISGFLAGLFSSRLIKRAMIVAPKTLMPHWIKELTAVGLSDKIKEYYGTCPKLRQYELQYVFQNRGILLTTYDIVRFNEKQLHGNGYYDDDGDDEPLWDYMVLDEGHLIKNPSTQRAKSLLGIPCSHRIIISGTPIQNNLKELWALFNFCCPDLLGDHKEFKERYEHPILRGNDKRASERDKRVGSMVAKELRERIQPYFLRRLKSEVFHEDDSKLSKKNEIIVWLCLTSCQRQLYEAFLKSEIVLSAFDGSPLAAITILKKICDHPYLLTKRAAEDVLEGMDSMLNQEDCGLAEKLAMHAAQLTEENDFQEKHDNLSCKISFILSLLNKLIPEGHNVLIFSQTRKMLNLIQESLSANGFEFLRIDGTTKATDRLKIVDKFQEGHGPPIFLLTSQVGGLGLTLTNADRVIVVDPAWNPSTDNQSVDRAYRIGQKKDVIVYRLMTCSTIEEKIYRMQIYKGGLFKTATEHKEQTRYFSQQDLKELFSLPKDGFDVSPTQLQLLAEHGDQITMSDDLKAHIKFLESLGIGGVSDHSLLYSKTEPTQAVDIKEEEIRRNTTKIYQNYGSSSKERYVDGSRFAFNPKDVNRHNINSSPQHSAKMTESEIKERMNRLSQILSNKATVARLPDSGEKIRKQLTELTSELEKLATPEKSNEVIDLDDLSGTLHRSLNV